jgi:hypothetical protein
LTRSASFGGATGIKVGRSVRSDHQKPSWAEQAIEEACLAAEDWYRSLPQFPNRVNLGSVVGFRHPAILSEQDCVFNFARFLNGAGIPWDAIHAEVSGSRWLFDDPHPGAATGGSRWRADLALIDSESFLAEELPARAPGFQFDAFLEFSYIPDSWTVLGAAPWGEPKKSRAKVEADMEKIAGYMKSGLCRLGYAIVFEEAESGFPPELAAEVEAETGCRLRFVRGYGNHGR